MHHHKGTLVAAFAAVYIFWGSTYLAIRFAIETMPPFLMSGTRFVVAGSLLFLFMAARGTPLPTARQWFSTTVIGGLLLLGGNGCVVYAEERGIASGLVALLVATVPLWMVLLDWKSRGRLNPGWRLGGGITIGFIGVAMLVLQDGIGNLHIDPLGFAAIVIGSLTWSAGSIYARTADLPRATFQTTAMQLLMGGVWMLLAGLLRGEAAHVTAAAWSLKSLASFAWLVFFGSIVGYSAYVYILRESTPAMAGTYAFVNPAVAVFLGWALAGERFTPMTLAAALVIIASVALITSAPRPAQK